MSSGFQIGEATPADQRIRTAAGVSSQNEGRTRAAVTTTARLAQEQSQR